MMKELKRLQEKKLFTTIMEEIQLLLSMIQNS